MSEARNSQTVVEDAQQQSPTARVSQDVVETSFLDNPTARVSQVVIETAWLPAPPPPPAPSPTRGGAGGGVPVPRAHNRYDLCLLRHVEICRKLCLTRKRQVSWPWDQEEGVPDLAEPFRRTNGIVTPFPAAGDVTIFSFRVPIGYDGVILQGYTGYTGPGFVQGSGDILWRLGVNSYWAKDWGNLAYALGSVTNPIPFTDAYFIQSGQLISMVVNVPNLSGAIASGGSLILAGLFGYYLPRASW